MQDNQEKTAAPAPPWRIGVDVGGTFTDMVMVDAAGSLSIVKVPSVPDNPGEGVINAVERAATEFGLSVGDLLAGCRLFVHGTTVATNTVLEGKGARVGLLATEGFRDSLEIRRGIRENPWDHRTPYPPVLVPRYLRRPVAGRLDPQGVEIEPISGADVADACRLFADEGVESVAVCLFNSYADGRHEEAVAEELARHWGGEWLSVSSRIAPSIGEYERTSTAVMNAYVAPRVVGYLQALNERLGALGLPVTLLLCQSNGGVVSVDQIAERPVNLVLSGPAAGVGALNLVANATGDNNLIAMEIGGTSCDVSLMSEGEVATTDSLEIGGYQLAIPSVEIHTVGAGGGTIAGVDAAGMLYAGPEGAGARPGPACYGHGGDRPTVTDAQLVLGRLKPGAYAGGSVTLDMDLARRAIEKHLGQPLGLSVEDAAAGIIRLVEQHLLHAVERISVQRGYDPRRFTLVPAGGAGPVHGPSVARRLGARRVYVPRQAGAFCANGLLQSDLRQDYVQVFIRRLDEGGTEAFDAAFATLEERAAQSLAAEGFSGDDCRFERGLDLRYEGQQSDVRIVIAPGRFDAAEARRLFEREYERQFGHVQPGATVRVTAVRVAGLGLLPPIEAAVIPAAADIPQPLEYRQVWFADGWRETAVYDGADLKPGHRLNGPLIIAEQTMTAIAEAGDVLTVDAAGNFAIELGKGF